MRRSHSEAESQVEHIVHTSEILAVAHALQSGGEPRVGQNIDYYLEPEAAGFVVVGAKPSKRGKPYRATIEQWHLDAAREMVKRLPRK